MWQMRPVGSPYHPSRRGFYQRPGHPVGTAPLIIRSHPVGARQFNPAMSRFGKFNELKEIRVPDAALGFHISQMIDAKIDVETAKVIEQVAGDVAWRIELHMPSQIARDVASMPEYLHDRIPVQ